MIMYHILGWMLWIPVIDIPSTMVHSAREHRRRAAYGWRWVERWVTKVVGESVFFSWNVRGVHPLRCQTRCEWLWSLPVRDSIRKQKNKNAARKLIQQLHYMPMASVLPSVEPLVAYYSLVPRIYGQPSPTKLARPSLKDWVSESIGATSTLPKSRSTEDPELVSMPFMPEVRFVPEDLVHLLCFYVFVDALSCKALRWVQGTNQIQGHRSHRSLYSWFTVDRIGWQHEKGSVEKPPIVYIYI